MGKFSFILAVSACLWVQDATASPQTAKISDLSDNIRVDQLAMVGSHNASTALEYGWFYGQQKSKIETQFAAGSRFFKTPIHWYDPHKGMIGTIKKGVHFLTRKKGNEPFIALCHEYPGKNKYFSVVVSLRNLLWGYLRLW